MARFEKTLANALALPYTEELAPLRALVKKVPRVPEAFFGAAWKEPAVEAPQDRTSPQTWLDLDAHGS